MAEFPESTAGLDDSGGAGGALNLAQPQTSNPNPRPTELDPDTGETRPAGAPARPGFVDRFLANYNDAHWTGTFRGLGNLQRWQTIVDIGEPDRDGSNPQYMVDAYDEAKLGLAKADAELILSKTIAPAESLGDYGTALLGQLAGGILTPESVLSIPLRIGGLAGRPILAAGLEGAAANLALDPAVQIMAQQEGVQEGYEIERTFFAPVTGLVAGSGLAAAGQGIKASARATWDQITGRARITDAAINAGIRDAQTGAPRVESLDGTPTQPAPEQTAPVGRAAPGDELQSEQTYRIRIADLATDPTTFQYKSGGDQEGVTAALKGIESFDEAKAGRIIVFQKNDGSLVVADGHQRTGLARRLITAGKEPADLEITALVYREADGFKPEDVRAIAAAANLATGTGSATDAAKVLRSRPDLADGTLPPNSQLVRDAKGLAKLTDDNFGMVVNDVVPERYGAMIGNAFPDPERQGAAMRAIAKLDPANADEAAVLIERIKVAAVEKAETGAQGSFFDDMLSAPESTVIEEMKIVGRALRKLKTDATVFRGAVRKADTLEEAGSKIARGESEARADEAAKAAFIAEKSFDTQGDIRSALTELARQVKKGEKSLADASFEFGQAVRRSQRDAEGIQPAKVEQDNAPAADDAGPDLFGAPKMAAMATGKPGSRQELEGLIANKAPGDDVLAHPIVKQADEMMRAQRPGPTAEVIAADPAYMADRKFSFDGETVTGYDQGVARLVQKAESYAGGEVRTERRAVIVTGPPAAGKSTLAEGLARSRGAMIIDPDDAKLVLPEYNGGLGTGPVHEESSFLAALVLQNAVRRDANIVIPTVGKDPAKVRTRAQELIDLGYTVDLVNLEVESNELSRRMAARFLKTGRLIPLDYFETIGDRPLNTYRTLSREGIFAETSNIDNTINYRHTDGSERLSAEALAARSERSGDGGGRPANAGAASGETGAGGEGGGRAGGGGAQGEGASLDAFGNAAGPQALAPGSIQGQAQRPAGGIADTRSPAQRQGPPPEQIENTRSLIERVREALNLPVRQGRFSIRGQEGTTVQGQYDARTGVTRQRVVDDFEAFAHEAGHHLEARFGPELRPLVRQNVHRRELGALDYDPQRGNISEGFAEFFRLYMENPTYARNVAPNFFQAFDSWLHTTKPDIARELDAVRLGYQDLINAPSGLAIEADIVSTYNPGGLRGVFRRIKEDGLRNTIAVTMSNWYTSAIDEKNPLYKAVRALARIHYENTGQRINLKAVDDPYKLARLAMDAHNAGHLDLMHGVHGYRSLEPDGPSLREAIVLATGQSNAFGRWDPNLITKFDSYLISRRALFEHGRHERGEIPNAPTAATKGDHEVNVAELEAQFPQFAQAAAMVHEWTRNLLRKEFDAGLISRDQYDAALAIQDYVPFMRDMTDRDPSASTSADKNLRQNIMRRFRGSSRPIVSPLESLMKRAYDTNILIRQNDLVKALDRLALSAGNGGGAIAERIPAREMSATHVNVEEAIRNAARDAGIDPVDASALVRQVSDLLGDDAHASIFRMGDITARGEPIVFFWEGGQRQALRLADGEFGREMYQVLTGMPKHMQDIWINTVAGPAAVLRASITTSPDFLIANYLRDQMSAWILTEGYIPFWSGGRGIADEVAGRDIARWHAVAGGMSGGQEVAAVRDARIERDLNALKRTGWLSQKLPGKAGKPFNLEGLAQFAETSETGTRLGVFRQAYRRSKAEGLDDWEAAIEAAYYARDLIDFGRHGSRNIAAMRLVPFFNAALQGLDKANRVLFEPAAKHLTGRVLTVEDQRALGASMKAWAKLSALALMSMGLRALYWDDPDFDEGTEYIRATHWLFKLPGSDVAWRVPKPFELAIPINLAERAFEYFALNDPTAVGKFFRSVAEVTSPPNPLGTPLVKVPFEAMTNTSFQNVSLFEQLFGAFKGEKKGRPIVPEHLKGLEPWLQYTHRTSVISKFMGEQINVSPAVLDHYIFGFTGSWGRGILALADQMSGQKGERGWEDTFITRRFMWNVSRGSSSTTTFWEQVAKQTGDLERKSASYKAMVDQGRLAEAADHVSKLSDDERAYVTLNRSEFDADTKRLHPLRRARDAMEVISAMRRDIAFGNLKAIADHEPIEVTRSQKRTLDDALSHVAMVEARNALVTTGHKGWAQRQVMPTAQSYDVIRELNPAVYDELAKRYATAKVHKFDAVARNWADTKNRLIQDGSDATLGDLKGDVKSDGYELDETRQRKAKQRYYVPGRAATGR